MFLNIISHHNLYALIVLGSTEPSMNAIKVRNNKQLSYFLPYFFLNLVALQTTH